LFKQGTQKTVKEKRVRIKSINLNESKLFGVLTGSLDCRTSVANALLEGTDEWLRGHVALRAGGQGGIYRTENNRVKLAFYKDPGGPQEMAAYVSEDKLLKVISGVLGHTTLVGHLRDKDKKWYRLYLGTYQDGELYRTKKMGDLKLNLRGEPNTPAEDSYEKVWQD